MQNPVRKLGMKALQDLEGNWAPDRFTLSDSVFLATDDEDVRVIFLELVRDCLTFLSKGAHFTILCWEQDEGRSELDILSLIFFAVNAHRSGEITRIRSELGHVDFSAKRERLQILSRSKFGSSSEHPNCQSIPAQVAA